MRCNQWPHLRLGAVASVKGGKRLPKGELLKTEATPHPYIRVRDIGPNRRLSVNDGFEYVSRAVQQQIQRYTVRAGDVIISIVGSIGLLAVIDLSLDGANLTENCAKIVDLDSVDGDFLYYYLSSDLGQDEIRKRTVGAVQAKLPLKNIADIPIPCPPLPEQRAIAAMLSCLDDKIELNNRMNKTLEEMAQALFKSWFVDFDPVKAKMEGREPAGMDAETAALFPDEFEDSELGPIPKGWPCLTFGDVVKRCTLRTGSELMPVLSAVKTGELVQSDEYFSKRVYSNDTAKYIIVEPLDFAYNPARINIGSIGINRTGSAGCVSPVYVVFRARDTYQNYLDLLIRQDRLRSEIASRSSGSVRQTLDFVAFAGIRVAVPEFSVVDRFNSELGALRATTRGLQEETESLSTIRDTLLPKLMSGEIRVPEAEDILEEVL